VCVGSDRAVATPASRLGRARAPRGAERLLGVATIVLALGAGCQCPATTSKDVPGGTSGTPTSGASNVAGPAAAGDAGMKAYIDPATGNFTDTPPPGTPELPGDAVMPEGPLHEEPAPGGGVMIDLTGRSNSQAPPPKPSQR